IEGAPEIPALLEAERRQAPLAPAEVALVEEEDGEAGGQPGRDRQHVGTVGRIAVQEAGAPGRGARHAASRRPSSVVIVTSSSVSPKSRGASGTASRGRP